MAIPIDISLIANAMNLQTPLQAVPMNLCKTPGEGLRCVPLQIPFTFNSGNQAAWLIDLSAGGSSPPLSQICSMYVDTRQCANDITVIFPDTGYQFTIGFGNGEVIPVLTGPALPKFYVVNNNENGFCANDIANVFAINQFIPEFNSSNFINNLNYGLGIQDGDQILLKEPFISNSTHLQSKVVNLVGITSVPLISSDNQLFISSMQVYASYSTSEGTGWANIEIFEVNSGIVLFSLPVGVPDANIHNQQLLDFSNPLYRVGAPDRSSPPGLSIRLNDFDSIFTSLITAIMTVTINIQGGITT